MTKRAYKYRFYPTDEQKELLARTFGCVRFVWNEVLRWRTDAFYRDQVKVGYLESNAHLTEMKKDPERVWLNEVSSVPLQQVLRHQQAAFKNFFEGRTKYPVMKKKSHRQSAEFTRSAFNYRDGKLYMAKSNQPLAVRWSRDLPGEPSTITISMDWAGRYFVSCLCEFEPKVLPTSTKTVGIDLGLKDLFVTDDGTRVGNPRHTAKYAARLALAQRSLSRKKPGSANRLKARRKVARIHAKISDCRQDGLHKLSHRLINENQVVCVESLRVKNMIKNKSLSKSIADAGWGELVRQITYKGDWAGRQVVAIDQFYPSTRRCSCCGYLSQPIPLSVRTWTCPECGQDHDRDVNAAANIKAAGQAVLALGAGVSLKPPVGKSNLH